MIQETEFIELDIFTDWMCREIQLCLSSFSMKSFHELIMETCIYWNISYVISNELKIIPCYWILLFSCYFISTIAFVITVIWFLLFFVFCLSLFLFIFLRMVVLIVVRPILSWEFNNPFPKMIALSMMCYNSHWGCLAIKIEREDIVCLICAVRYNLCYSL